MRLYVTSIRVIRRLLFITLVVCSMSAVQLTSIVVRHNSPLSKLDVVLTTSVGHYIIRQLLDDVSLARLAQLSSLVYNDAQDNKFLLRGWYHALSDSRCLAISQLDLSHTNYITPDVIGALPTHLTAIKVSGIDCPWRSPIRFPDNLRQMHITCHSDPIPEHMIPDTLTELSFGIHHQQQSPLHLIKPNLIRLQFGSQFNQPLFDGCLSSTLQHLTFSYGFQQIILPNCLPNSLKTLRFADDFNVIFLLDTLPESLEEIYLGAAFNQPIAYGDGINNEMRSIFPSSLRRLVLGTMFNQKLSVLPAQLVELHVGRDFQMSIDPALLPLSLTIFVICWEYDQWIPSNRYPPLLSYITIFKDDNYIQMPIRYLQQHQMIQLPFTRCYADNPQYYVNHGVTVVNNPAPVVVPPLANIVAANQHHHNNNNGSSRPPSCLDCVISSCCLSLCCIVIIGLNVVLAIYLPCDEECQQNEGGGG